MNAPAIPHDRQSWERLAGALRPEGRALIAGRLQAAQDGRVFQDVSPIDGSLICEVARGAAADIDLAVAAARRSFESGSWRRTAPKERKRILRRFAEAIRADTARLALLETRDVGKPISNSVGVDVANCADCIEYYAEFADKTTGAFGRKESSSSRSRIASRGFGKRSATACRELRSRRYLLRR